MSWAWFRHMDAVMGVVLVAGCNMVAVMGAQALRHMGVPGCIPSLDLLLVMH